MGTLATILTLSHLIVGIAGALVHRAATKKTPASPADPKSPAAPASPTAPAAPVAQSAHPMLDRLHGLLQKLEDSKANAELLQILPQLGQLVHSPVVQPVVQAVETKLGVSPMTVQEIEALANVLAPKIAPALAGAAINPTPPAAVASAPKV